MTTEQPVEAVRTLGKADERGRLLVPRLQQAVRKPGRPFRCGFRSDLIVETADRVHQRDSSQLGVEPHVGALIV